MPPPRRRPPTADRRCRPIGRRASPPATGASVSVPVSVPVRVPLADLTHLILEQPSLTVVIFGSDSPDLSVDEREQFESRATLLANSLAVAQALPPRFPGRFSATYPMTASPWPRVCLTRACRCATSRGRRPRLRRLPENSRP
jgi:hypothetical protein